MILSQNSEGLANSNEEAFAYSSPSDGNERGPRWLHIERMKSLAKAIRKAKVASYCAGLEAVSRSVGYKNYAEAVHSPRVLHVGFDEWRARLLRELDLDSNEAFDGDELATLFGNLLVRSGRYAVNTEHSREFANTADDTGAWVTANEAEREVDEERAEDAEDGRAECVPAHVRHDSTIVDAIAARPRRAKSHGRG